MTLTLAFDVYGTLVDTAGVTEQLARHVGERAPAFARLWRDKQLEYSFRRGLMRNYEPFTTCTRQALDYTCAALGAGLSGAERDDLMAAYGHLPAFPDARPCLEALAAADRRLFAFSNGPAAEVERVLANAGLAPLLEGVVSVEAVQSFKPDPAVYAHFLRATRATTGGAWLVSGNSFDVIGALSAGWCAAWVRRTPEAVYDPWGLEPTARLESLVELPEALAT